MTRKRALGRGLDALIGARSRAQASEEEVSIHAEQEQETSTKAAKDSTRKATASKETSARNKSVVPTKSAQRQSPQSSPSTKSPAGKASVSTSDSPSDDLEKSTYSASSTPKQGTADDARKKSVPAEGELIRVTLGSLSRGRFQPRREFNQDRLEELAESIKTRGVMQPIVVRPISDQSSNRQRYEIIAGERRWRAAQLAELSVIPAVVRELDDEAALALALIENIQREDLNVVEETLALKRLLDEFDLTQQQVAEAVGKSRAQVANLIRLLSLESEVLGMLERHELDVGHARALLALKGSKQRHTARDVVAKGLTVRQTESLVRRLLKPKEKESARNTDVMKLELQLGELLGAAVKIDHGKSGKGKVSINYSSLDELDGILGHIR